MNGNLITIVTDDRNGRESSELRVRSDSSDPALATQITLKTASKKGSPVSLYNDIIVINIASTQLLRMLRLHEKLFHFPYLLHQSRN
jgi:P pilus assembly chaperone PapD